MWLKALWVNVQVGECDDNDKTIRLAVMLSPTIKELSVYIAKMEPGENVRALQSCQNCH